MMNDAMLLRECVMGRAVVPQVDGRYWTHTDNGSVCEHPFVPLPVHEQQPARAFTDLLARAMYAAEHGERETTDNFRTVTEPLFDYVRSLRQRIADLESARCVPNATAGETREGGDGK
jgi:hypothetical protein